jgi:hypothetical protein
VSGLAGDPLPAGGKLQIARRILVAAEGARDRNEAVAEEAICDAAGRFGGRSGDRVAGDAVGQGNAAARVLGFVGEAVAPLPILVHQVAVAQVGDAGAADLPSRPNGAA